MAQHFACTADYPRIVREIYTEIGISLPIAGNVLFGDPRVFKTSALWDTGATGSAITPATVKALDLKPIRRINVNHAGGTSLQNVYLTDIYLPNGIVINGVSVTECSEHAGNFGVLVGMDVISLGDFTISNANSRTTMSFRMPSMERIDYVNTHTKITPVKAPALPGRNEKCPCGSGKKYKDCCGKK